MEQTNVEKKVRTIVSSRVEDKALTMAHTGRVTRRSVKTFEVESIDSGEKYRVVTFSPEKSRCTCKWGEAKKAGEARGECSHIRAAKIWMEEHNIQ